MKIFLDTSTVVKLYYQEKGSQEIDDFLNANVIDAIFLSEISKIEFAAVWKKFRTGEISEIDAELLIIDFLNDYSEFQFIELSNSVFSRASGLVRKYRTEGLRTLDSIQLSSALEVANDLDKSFTADKKLQKIMLSEGIK